MFGEKIIKRIPGKPYIDPKEKQGYIDDLSSKSRSELLMLLERQVHLLENKLPDKGERIKAFKQRVENALAQVDQVDQTCGLLLNLKLNSHGGVPEEIEWTGKCPDSQHSGEDSDDEVEDDETDPLKILASQGNIGTYKKKTHRLLKNREDAEMKDLLEPDNASNGGGDAGVEVDKVGEMEKDASSVAEMKNDFVGDTYAKILCSKIDQASKIKKEPFRPYCTTKSGMHPGLHTPKHLGPHWEVTAATPPPPVHGATKPLSLQESMEIQKAQAEKLKEIQAKHATERLAASSHTKSGPSLPPHSRRIDYRSIPLDYDSGASSDEGNLELSGGEEEDEKRDTIVYTYTE